MMALLRSGVTAGLINHCTGPTPLYRVLASNWADLSCSM